MMYQNKFVAAIKADGKILRESSNLVTLPFGSEYSILLKNLNSVRAMAEITIDGKSATDGSKLILDANGSVEIERYIRNHNFEKGNRFKFIERTNAVEQYRGIGADDGIIRVEFWTEKVYPAPTWQSYTTTWQYPVSNTGFIGGQWTNSSGLTAGATKGSGVLRSANFASTVNSTACAGAGYTTMDWSQAQNQQQQESGITVPGSESSQKFTNGSWFATEYQTDVLVFQLRGEIAGKPVQKPITVAVRPRCVTCDSVNWATAKFCSQCGTALQLI